jgi:hypothetical protein
MLLSELHQWDDIKLNIQYLESVDGAARNAADVVKLLHTFYREHLPDVAAGPSRSDP